MSTYPAGHVREVLGVDPEWLLPLPAKDALSRSALITLYSSRWSSLRSRLLSRTHATEQIWLVSWRFAQHNKLSARVAPAKRSMGCERLQPTERKLAGKYSPERHAVMTCMHCVDQVSLGDRMRSVVDIPGLLQQQPFGRRVKSSGIALDTTLGSAQQTATPGPMASTSRSHLIPDILGQTRDRIVHYTIAVVQAHWNSHQTANKSTLSPRTSLKTGHTRSVKLHSATFV